MLIIYLEVAIHDCSRQFFAPVLTNQENNRNLNRRHQSGILRPIKRIPRLIPLLSFDSSTAINLKRLANHILVAM